MFLCDSNNILRPIYIHVYNAAIGINVLVSHLLYLYTYIYYIIY
jgi:hypothetical protein